MFLMSLLFGITFIGALFCWTKKRQLEHEYIKMKDEFVLLQASILRNECFEKDELEKKDLNLSSRQQEILNLMAMNLSNREIAERLFISENTVKFHVKNIFKLYNVNDRRALWLSQCDDKISD